MAPSDGRWAGCHQPRIGATASLARRRVPHIGPAYFRRRSQPSVAESSRSGVRLLGEMALGVETLSVKPCVSCRLAMQLDEPMSFMYLDYGHINCRIEIHRVLTMVCLLRRGTHWYQSRLYISVLGSASNRPATSRSSPWLCRVPRSPTGWFAPRT